MLPESYPAVTMGLSHATLSHWPTLEYYWRWLRSIFIQM